MALSARADLPYRRTEALPKQADDRLIPPDAAHPDTPGEGHGATGAGPTPLHITFE